MKSYFFFFASFAFLITHTFSQNFPTFGPQKRVTITGLTFDAMEVFISIDGNTLFFNSLNSGGNTNLYYATKMNDTTFNYVGNVAGTYDPSSNHLDAVASIDSANNFYWVSLRKIPNLHRGNYLAGNVSNVSQVFGDFNILTPSGWLIMDAAINFSGNLLYYSSAYFGPTYTECPGLPCKAKLGVAQKVNDSTFNKLVNSDAIFSNVNDSNYIVYAPQVTKDGLELYFTRLLKGGINTEICLATRNVISDAFGLPTVLYSNLGKLPEAASPSTDKQKIYYHQKDESLTYRVYLRYRTVTTGLNEHMPTETISVYPNPTDDKINVQIPFSDETFELALYSAIGKKIFSATNRKSIDISDLPKGFYFLSVKQNNKTSTTKIIKN